LKRKHIILALVSVLIASLILIPTVLAEPTNETVEQNITADDDDWYNAEWGGDTGGEEYTAPTINNGTDGDGGGFFDGLCNMSICGTSLIFGICVPVNYYLQKVKRKEDKDG